MKTIKTNLKGLLRRCVPALILPSLLLLQGCPNEVEPEVDTEQQKINADPDYKAKSFLRKEYMDVYYYWCDQVKSRNASFKPYDYSSIYEWFDALLYSKDRWSWMMDKDTYISEETGVMTGTWGVSIGQAVEYYGDYSMRVRYIHPGSPFEQFGVTRGAKILKINGVDVEDRADSPFDSDKLAYFNESFYKSPQTFTFRLANGRDTTFKATMAASLATRTCLKAEVFQPDEFEGLPGPVGYFHFLSFTYGPDGEFLKDIREPMQTFREAGVRNLIVDLRYNGGGDSRVSDLLISYLAPKEAQGRAYVVRKHNSNLSGEDQTSSIKKNDESLELDHIYFITGHGTASASEMVMNGLKPYMGDKMKMVGQTTYGKPNGMYVLMYPGSDSDYERYNRDDYSKLQWVFLPICFYNQNSLGQNIPDDGFTPDNSRPDDLFHDFGVNEGDINACLTHLVSGSWPELPSVSSVRTKASVRKDYLIEKEEDAAGYGRYVVQRQDF